MSTLPLSGGNSSFFSAIPLFFSISNLKKCALYALPSVKWNSDDSAASFQCSAKLIRSPKCCVFCLFVKLQLSPGHVEGPDKDMIPGYRSSGKIRVASRRYTYYSTSYTPWRWKKYNSRFLRFSSSMSSFFVC